jgi:hypothetical protein
LQRVLLGPPASASVTEPNMKPPQSSLAALALAESHALEEPTSYSVSFLVAGLGEHHRAEQEATAVTTNSLGTSGELRARRTD